MNLGTLVIIITAIAFFLTMAVGSLFGKHKQWLMTFLQNWTGVLFIISGFVKAIDPLGTGYKMEQYFAEFQNTFAETALSSLAPLFPFLSEHSLLCAILMIVLEIILGVMLLLGSKPFFTAWSFLLLVVFFTLLTGFTYLTGYVPADVNFFEFGSWSAYNPLQMKVTDCGCFGDFIKLEPRTSFFKDVVLLVPAVYFVFAHRQMHQIFSAKTRQWIVLTSLVLISLYCVRNSVWALPHTDFRPFKEGVNIAERKAIEEQAQADVEIVSYTLKNMLTGKYVELPYAQYLKEYKSYPTTDWEVVTQNLTEPVVEETKISEFIIYGPDDGDVTVELLSRTEPFFMFISHKLYADGNESITTTVTDSVAAIIDTLFERSDTTFIYGKKARSRKVTRVDYEWNPDFLKRFQEVVLPLSAEAKLAGVGSVLIAGGADKEMMTDFKQDAGIEFALLNADDILLKTIVRSNPGILLMQEGVILGKWHYRKVPDFATIKAELLD
ncbi:MAG: hypothetical protein HKN87_24340 [Saprospiraceae bacterium]|nr:hypothetical protein [Saprospiraceae bacterium]